LRLPSQLVNSPISWAFLFPLLASRRAAGAVHAGPLLWAARRGRVFCTHSRVDRSRDRPQPAEDIPSSVAMVDRESHSAGFFLGSAPSTMRGRKTTLVSSDHARQKPAEANCVLIDRLLFSTPQRLRFTMKPPKSGCRVAGGFMCSPNPPSVRLLFPTSGVEAREERAILSSARPFSFPIRPPIPDRRRVRSCPRRWPPLSYLLSFFRPARRDE
jgi:hypothetical protein